MARSAKGGLSRHEKGYRIQLGKTPEGKYRVFWLGHNRFSADYAAMTLRSKFAAMQAQGRDVWTAADVAEVRPYLDAAKAMVTTMPTVLADQVAAAEAVVAERKQVQANFAALTGVGTAPAAPASPTPATAADSPVMLHAAIDAYLTMVAARPVSAGYRKRTAELVSDLKRYRPDVPLAQVDRVWLQSLCDSMKARPKSPKTGRPLSPFTVRNMLVTWRGMFDWLDSNSESDRFGRWQAPRRWVDLFDVRPTKLMTKAERDQIADGPAQITAEQIVRAYRQANFDLHRCCILLGVFAALGQRELSSLRRDEFDLKAGTLDHRRNKTGQRGLYHLPAEVVTVLKRYFKAHKAGPDGAAFMTAEGSALVSDKSDSVRQAWDDLTRRANAADAKAPPITHGFYALRRFAGDFAMRHGGAEGRDTFLAHAPASVGARHYSNTRDFAKVAEVGRKLADELRAAGLFND
jgi:integrase